MRPPIPIALTVAVLCACGEPGTTSRAADGSAARDGQSPQSDAGSASRDAAPDDAAATQPLPDYAFPCVRQQGREPTGEATFEAIYVDIFCEVGCTDGYCHGPRGGWAGLTMTTIEGAYAALVDEPPGDFVPVDGRETCRDSPLLRVDPGAPERSLLYLKVTAETPCGVPMPPPDSGRRALSAQERAQVRAWIEAGAPLSDAS